MEKSLRSPEFLPGIVAADNKSHLLLLAITTMLIGGFLEELGWTGLAIPRLKRRHGALALFVPLYFFAGVGQLPAYRVLIVWV